MLTKSKGVAVTVKMLGEAQHCWSVNFNTFQSWLLHYEKWTGLHLHANRHSI